MKKSKKILAGVLATVSMMSCMAMPAMAYTESNNYPVVDKVQGSSQGRSYYGTVTLSSTDAYGTTTASNTAFVHIKTEFYYVYQNSDRRTTFGENSGYSSSVSARAIKESEHSIGGVRGYEAAGQHDGSGWNESTRAKLI